MCIEEVYEESSKNHINLGWRFKWILKDLNAELDIWRFDIQDRDLKVLRLESIAHHKKNLIYSSSPRS
jgi:hypothetical protein